jgi:hypothetical protein
LDDALLIARRFEAANATMQTLAMQGQGNNSMIGAVSSMRKVVTCFVCNGFGHVAKQCPTLRNSFKQDTQLSPKVCYLCRKPGHIARNCFISKPGQGDVQNSQGKHVANRKSLVCYRCGKEGHIAKFCRTVLDDTKEAVQSQYQRLNNQQNRTCMQNETQSKIRLSTISPTSKRKTLIVEAQINGKSKLCIVDTGASISLVSKNEWQLLKGNNASLTPSDIVAEAANNSPKGILGKTALDVKVDPGHISCHSFMSLVT